MNYQARTDLFIEQTEAPTPVMGPAGSIVIAPAFDSRIIRATDEHTLQLGGGLPSAFCAAGVGGSADVNTWNKDSTMLYVQDSGGQGGILGFGPTTLAVTRLFPKWRVPGGAVFSKLDPNILFVLQGTQYFQYDLTDRTAQTPPPATLVCDFATEIPGPFTWKTLGGVENKDTIFSAGFSVAGAQNSAVYACVFTLGKGYRTLNTQTGMVTGTWGPVGAVSCLDRFFVHNVKSNKTPGDRLIVEATAHLPGQGPTYFWEHDDLSLKNIGSVAWGGHWTAGGGKFFNCDSSPTIPYWAHTQRYFTDLTHAGKVANPSPTPTLMVGLDDHPSFNGPPSSLLVTTSAGLGRTPFPAPWWDEVLGFDLSGSGKVYRFCHTFTSGKSKAEGNFYFNNAIGCGDQKNQFVAFTSDWMGTLLNGRGDVFIVALR